MQLEIQTLINNPSAFSETDILDMLAECTSDELNELYLYGSDDLVKLVDDVTYRRI